MDITVHLEKKPNQTLGIGFKKLPKPPYCQVFKLVPNGAASQSGKVNEGDLLLSIEGHNVQNLSPDEARDIIARYSTNTKLLLELRRSPTEVPNGVVPSINVDMGSPELCRSPEFNGSPGSSPDTSPQMNGRHHPRRRPGRSGLIERGGLPGIQEGAMSNASTGLFPPEKRHSLTPELTRKTHVLNPLKQTKSLDLANLPQWRQATEQIAIQNLIEGTELHDRLHNQDLKVSVALCI